MAEASVENGCVFQWISTQQWGNQSAKRAGKRWIRGRLSMNRKKRNKWKLLYRHGFTAWAGSIAWQIPPHPDFARKSNQVNDSRKAARLRRLYHRCADWDCPKWQLNEKLCEHCQHLYRCYAKLSWLINAWPGPVNLQEGGWRYVPRSRAMAR
jgi:hypothetical protein